MDDWWRIDGSLSDHWKRCDKPNAINPSFGDGWYCSNIFCVARKSLRGPKHVSTYIWFCTTNQAWCLPWFSAAEAADFQKSFRSWDSAMSMLAMSVMCKHVDVIQPTSNSPSLDKLSDLHESHHIPSQPLYVWHPGFEYWNWIYLYRGGGEKELGGIRMYLTFLGLDKLHSSYIPI